MNLRKFLMILILLMIVVGAWSVPGSIGPALKIFAPEITNLGDVWRIVTQGPTAIFPDTVISSKFGELLNAGMSRSDAVKSLTTVPVIEFMLLLLLNPWWIAFLLVLFIGRKKEKNK